jgi:hypothetical protein
VEIEGTAKKFLATLAKARAELAAWAKQDPMATLGLHMGEFRTEMATAKTELLDFAATKADAKLGVDVGFFEEQLGLVKAAADVAGMGSGSGFMDGFYRAVQYSPDWRLLGNIARDAAGNQMAIGPAGSAAGADFMDGFYRAVQSSPDWRLVGNIARDAMGNQLALGPAGSTGSGAGSSSWLASVAAMPVSYTKQTHPTTQYQ